MDRLVELAETLQCPVVDAGGRSNFPTRHPLNHTGRSGAVLAQADVILGIELNDFYGATHTFSDRIVRRTRRIIKPGVTHHQHRRAATLHGNANTRNSSAFRRWISPSPPTARKPCPR